MSAAGLNTPRVLRSPAGGGNTPDRPLVVLLHGRGTDETSMVGLAQQIPDTLDWVALRGPVDLDGSFTWFHHRGTGRPDPASLSESMEWFRSWLSDEVSDERPVVLVGFSGGATFAGAVLLDDPERFVGAALLHGVAAGETAPDRLVGVPVFLARASHDRVIPTELAQASRCYLVDDSGADITEIVTDGNHEIDAMTAKSLGLWLTARGRS